MDYYRAGIFLFCLFFPFIASGQSTIKKAASSIESTLSRCAACHGFDGNSSSNKLLPKLAAQNAVYLFKTLKSFRPGIKKGRKNAVMNAIVNPLSEKEMKEIANYYAALAGTIDTAQVALIPLGQRLYRGGDLTKGIPACLACHGPAGLGNSLAGFPRLSGQHAVYIAAQLKDFRSGKRDDQRQMMSVISKKMSDGEIEAVASYISGLYF